MNHSKKTIFFLASATLKTSVAKSNQRGLTMVELMVAMAVSLVISLAAISALIVARQGLTAVDSSSQLRDNSRFSAELIQRVAVQAGFKDRKFSATTVMNPVAVAGVAADPPPNITGVNNAWFDAASNTTTARVAGEEGYGSDVLVMRYQTAETFPGSAVSDGSMIDCAGNSLTTVAATAAERMVSVLHVALDQGEPTLMCSFSLTGATPFTSQPIVQGVENFQVLYGTDNVTPNTATVAATSAGAANAFRRADQFAVSSPATATNINWRRVRVLRVGLIVRGPIGSAQEKVALDLYPFGLGKSAGAASEGSSMFSTADPGTKFTTPVDSRLRQVVTFTVHLRNDQGI